MYVEKVQDVAHDGRPIGTILFWDGEWDRSPEDCWGRDRDPIPALRDFDGRPVPGGCASDWADVFTGHFLEACHWIDRAALRLREKGYDLHPIAARMLVGGDLADEEESGFEQEGGWFDRRWPGRPTVEDRIDRLAQRLLEAQQAGTDPSRQ